ncbi:MAG: chemotaxis protein CheA [Coriobacteriia bacterium]|nr:chemotaxis protein CheA [Coriobacteriia bacterium]
MVILESDHLLGEFEAEAISHIGVIETAFLDMNDHTCDTDMMSNVFRAAHSLKGTAGFFKLKKIVDVSHELESFFTQIKDESIVISDDIVDVVLRSVDCLRLLIDNMQDDDAIEIEQIIKELRSYSGVARHVDIEEVGIPFDFKDPLISKALEEAARFGHRVYYVHINYNRSLGKLYTHPEILIQNILSVATIVEALVRPHSVTGTEEITIRELDQGLIAQKLVSVIIKHDTSTLELLVTSILEHDLFSIAIEVDKRHIRSLEREAMLKKEQAKISEGKAAVAGVPHTGSKLHEAKDNYSIRLNIATINTLLDLANEMILTRNQLFSVMPEDRKSMPGIAPVLHNLSRLTSEIQEKVMITRMQPISVIFDKFPRIIRDTAKSLNKEISVEILRDDVTLDKYLLESLTDPITQLVKNSADHGLESSENRIKAGKPAKGVLRLNAYMHDGSAVIEVQDDGAGIDTEALKRKALEQGTSTEQQLAAMSHAEVLSLVFCPGVSTAKKVTNLSGRGVGMDIVKTNIESLGGSVEIESELCKGTTVRLKMPLTLSVIRSLIVTIDSITYAVPDLNIERIVRIWSETSTKRIERINKSLVLCLDGRIIPVVTMNEIAAKAKGQPPVSVDEALDRSQHGGVVKCLVLRAGGKSFALLIDDALDTEQVLVKPLPAYLQNCSCYSNVTVLGNGKAVTILDAEGVMRFMELDDEGLQDTYVMTKDQGCNEPSEAKEKQVIIFKCSGSEHYAIETSDITRIEVIDPGEIQEIRRGTYINIADGTMRIVRPEDYAPVRKRAYNEEKLFVITLKESETPLGLLVRKVLDKVEARFELDKEQIQSDYLFGTSPYGEKILIFLNPQAIIEATQRDKPKIGAARKGGRI